MSIIKTISDVNNTFLSRRELCCDFIGLSGKLKKNEAIEMVAKEFGIVGKVIIPIKMENHVGKTITTGTFYIYDDMDLAKEHVNPTIIKRLEKIKNVKQNDSDNQDNNKNKENSTEEKAESSEK